VPTLLETLAPAPGALIAFVGAGGKTTTLQRLVTELRAAGRTVVSTSTVHMLELRGVAAHPFLIEPDPARLAVRLPPLLAAHGHVRVAGARERADKIRGLDPATVAARTALPGLDHVLVEADGARHRLLKAPAAHEPVLPAGVDHLLVLVSLDVLGQPLDPDVVHRPDAVSALAGVPPGTPLTVPLVARVLTHPAGGLKAAPPEAAVWVIATRLGPETEAAGRALADAILAAGHPGIRGIILLGPGAVDQVGSAALIAVRR